MKASHRRLMLLKGVITCGSVCEMARVYAPGEPVGYVRQSTLRDMARAGLLTRPIEMHDGIHIGGWLEFFPTFAVDDFEEQWNSWAP